MLPIFIPAIETWDSKRRVFVNTDAVTLHLEHSLVSLSKWESKWNKPFLGKGVKTDEETLDYIRCMAITPNVPQSAFDYIASSKELVDQIKEYIDAPMTATVFSKGKSGKANRDVITSEIIYYWMITFNIPVGFQHWHLNRLMTLIRVCSVKSAKPEKVSAKERMSSNKALNEARRRQHNTRG